MDLCNINDIKALLARHGFHFSKAKGQNFLTQSWVPREIVEASGIDEHCGVLEVGPGIGPLTNELCRAAKKVLAVEVDTSLQPILAETMAGNENLEILFRDILKTDIPALVREEFAGLRPMACANLPYYITSPVIMTLLESRLPIDTVTVMVQKEAAERLCAEVGTREAGAVSVAVSYYSKPEILFGVDKESFMPPPKVDSAVIKLKILEKPPVKVNDERAFFRLVKCCFAQRRKTLVNTVSNTAGIEKERIRNALDTLGISETARSEQLTLANLAELSNLLGG